MSMKIGAFKDVGNVTKGRILEHAVKGIYRREGYTVTSHSIFMGGYDVEAKKGNDLHIIECLNWYGGFIHRNRFLSITNNLAKSATSKFLVCCGVKPSKEQHAILTAMKVKVIHYKDQLFQITENVLRFLRSKLLGVITDCVCVVRGVVAEFICAINSDINVAFDWWRRLWKGRLGRFACSFHGFVRGGYAKE